MAEIAVVDNERGIPKADIERAFEPFFTTRLGEGGTGLGLSVADGVVAAHEGQVRIEQLEFGGTVVFVEFPIVPD